MPTVPSSCLLCQIRKQSIWSWVGACACRVLLVVEASGGSLLMDASSALWWPGQGPTLLIFTSNCHRLHFGRIITTASCIKQMELLDSDKIVASVDPPERKTNLVHHCETQTTNSKYSHHVQGLASYCKAETTFTFYFTILPLSRAFLSINNREMKSESGFSFAMASQPLNDFII